jgi:UPF0271 protein
MKRIDLNCDMGELDGAVEEAVMPFLTSVNVACGAHAGDAAITSATIRGALKFKLGVGAHPSYPDRENFGRKEMRMEPDALATAVFGQLKWLAALAKPLGAELVHVKPHGALYNTAAKDEGVALAIARGVARFSKKLVLVGLADSLMLQVFEQEGFRTAAEAFADRRYERDGSLRSRNREGALISDPAEAGRQAVEFVGKGRAATLCIHSDTPNAPVIAAEVARSLDAAGIKRLPL